MRNNIVLIGEENRINNELYQLLNWRFKVTYYNNAETISFQELQEAAPAIVITNIVGNNIDYHDLFSFIHKECQNTSVITISGSSDSALYEEFYEYEQFHKLVRPITGRRILEISRAIIAGKNISEEAVEVPVVRDEKQHILIVDDNAMVLRNIKGILDTKYSVAVATSGLQAFVSIGKKKPDLILLDYEMPTMNGKEVLEKLQSDEELSEIPVVFLTSADSREIVMELLALKPAGYILKPVEATLLFDRIEEIIGK